MASAIAFLITALLLFHFPATATAYETTAKQAVLLDLSSDTVLFDKESSTRLYPASMSKLMTVYVVFSRLKEGTLTLQDEFLVSEKAWRKQGSKMFVELGNAISVEDLLRGIIVQSGNDACIVIAEGLAGSEEAFAELMNETAKTIGLTGSHFTNSTGWPDENHYMTAQDLALLSRLIVEDFPEYYPYFAEESFTYHDITQPNRNTLLGRGVGADGLKTGHTDISGYGIAASAIDDDKHRLIAVVHGTDSSKARIREAEKLLRYGFAAFKRFRLFQPGQEVTTVPVWFGKEAAVPVVIDDTLPLTLPAGKVGSLALKVTHAQAVAAPIREGAHIADLRVEMAEREPLILPLYAARSVEKLSTLERLMPALNHYLLGAVGER